MLVVPSPTGKELTVQPSYFTSSLFVHPLREDILHLIHVFHERYVSTQPSHPFALFKTIWMSEGWQWMHFKVFDPRGRESFILVTARLFLEKVVAETEPLLGRVVALFGLYTFLWTVPAPSAHFLYTVRHVPIGIDDYVTMMRLESGLTTKHLRPLQAHTRYIISTLVSTGVLYILPMVGMNPLELPREIICEGYGGVKKGRRSEREKRRKRNEAVEQLRELII